MSDGSRRRALVTGASRGIGAAIARRLAADGHHVLVNYRERDADAHAVVESIVTAGGSAELLKFDVRDGAAVSCALAPVLEAGPVQILVNNAGITRDGVFASMTEEAWNAVLDTSLGGFFHVTRPLVLPMILGRFGRIVTITSVAGRVGSRGQVNYSAAKAGLIGATRALAREVASKGVTVNAIAPGFITSDMTADLDPSVRERIPARRLGTPEEVAALVSYLTSTEAGYVTGQVLGIDGGLGG